MNSNRERLETAGLIALFEEARAAQDVAAMTRILTRAKFTPLEIQSIVAARGYLGSEAATEAGKKSFWDTVVTRICVGLVSGVILGGVFAYASSGMASGDRHGTSGMSVAMTDYRSPSEAYYQPFIWGFVIGFFGGLVTGTLFYDPTANKD